MGEDLLRQIQELLTSLPPKDMVLGGMFIRTRDFESLKLLVDSDIQIEKNREASGKDPLTEDIPGLMALKAKVDRYCSYLCIPEQDDFGYYDGMQDNI